MKRGFLNSSQIFNCILFLLVLLWVYTASSKLVHFDTFKRELSMQHLPGTFLKILSYTLPLSELFVAILLIIPKTKRIGHIFSIILLGIFTIYILLILLGYFKNTPCSCGGVLKILDWKTHLLFNLFFISINAINLNTIINEERRLKAK